jgi:hypothetical protein
LHHRGLAARELPYERWQELDSFLAPKRRRDYEGTKPVFLVGSAEVDVDGAGTLCRRAAFEVHAALTLTTAAALLSPKSSIAYVKRDGGGIRRFMGPMEREAVVRDPVVTIDTSVLKAVLPTLKLVAANRAALAEGPLRQAVDTLAATSLPDFEAIDGIVHCAIGLEALLLADVTAGLAASFSERGAALLATVEDEIPRLREELDAAYRLRSDVLHGRSLTAGALAGRTLPEWYAWLRVALARAAARARSAIDGETDPDSGLAELRRRLGTTGGVPSALTSAPRHSLP